MTAAAGMKRGIWLLGCLSGCLLHMLVAEVASAQTEGFAINRFDPAERGSYWFTTDSLDLRGHGRLNLGLVGDWAYKPLVAYDGEGDEGAVILRHQVYGHLGGAVVLWDRVRLATSIPVLVYQKGSPGVVAGETYETQGKAALGDIRLSADARIVGQHEDVVTVAAGLAGHLPTGKRAAFAGDGGFRIVPRVLVAGRLKLFIYSARVGVNVRTQADNFGGEPFGTEMQAGAAVGLKLLDERLVVGPELWTSTVLSEGGAFDRVTTPVEALLGAHLNVGQQWRLGVGAGPGLTRGFGAPKLRVVAGIEYRGKAEQPPPPLPPPLDSDSDGIEDTVDACPAEAGEPNDDPKKHGCPRLDTDGDGVLDEEDACPSQAGDKSDDPEKNGCPPPPDADGDGIVDEEDACPNQAGDKNDDPEKNGCPPPADTDGDGIIDPEDACPDKPGKPNADNPSKHGCPVVVVEEGEIKIFQRIEFDTAKATIRPESGSILEAVLQVLKEQPSIKKVEIQGHTDSQGVNWRNKVLSRQRAAAVVKWLVEHGIEAERLTSNGYGADRPVDTNATEEGRQNNRRVQFVILEK